MLPRCGRVAHICEANRTVEWNCNKNLGDNRKESQLPSKSEGCNEIQGFRGNCDSQGKLGMCPSLAEPDSGGIPRRTSLRKNGLQRPAKGGSTPAFAYQRAAIAPLPCLNLQPWFSWFNFVWIGKFQKMQLQQGKQTAKLNLLRKRGLLAHTSAAFL